MKRAIVLGLILFLMLALNATEKVVLGSQPNSVRVVSSTNTETILEFTIGNYDQNLVEIDGSTWYHISLPKEGITQDKGMPELPVFNRSIVIDDLAKYRLEILDTQYTDVRLPVAPSKGVITRDVDPATVPYMFDRVYQSNQFYPQSVAELSEPYILRDYRGITVKTTPFAYKPDTQTLRVYTRYVVRIYGSGSDTVNTFTRSRSSISRDFAPLYQSHFINLDHTRYTPVSDTYGKLLVICHTNYMSTILPYVNWKKQKGIETELVQWSTIGSTAAHLQTYIQNRYNQDNTLTYVQLVGDAPQIPSLSSGGGGSDPTFALVAGSDNYPDIFIGRFSAETTAQVTTQVNRTIAYERDLTTADTWLSRAMGIASAEGGGSQGDNGESDITHMNNIRTDLLGYGYTTVDQVYDPGASASTVTTNVNAGRGFINYVGHGSDTSWVTTGFNSTNAGALTNGSKTPFIMDVACVNGNFVSITCFAEAWVRSTNGGAITIYASSINQSWNSPMRAQDEVTDLVIAEAKYTAGGLYYNGSCKMMDIYGNTAGSDGVNMYKTWHIFGDASVLIRTKTPQAMSVTHPAQIMIGASTLAVNTGVANALVALTYNNQIYGRGFTNSSGSVTLSLVNPPQNAITYTLTATAHNRVTYIGSVQQVPNSGPYLSVNSTQYVDSNNGNPDYNENGALTVTFENIGPLAASNITATLTCATAGITLTDATESIASLGAGATVTRNSAYTFTIANNIPNGTVAAFTITMTSGAETWTHEFSLVINAPALSFGNLTISDPTGNNNGKLDPGETVTITIPLNNTGGAASPAGSATMSSASPGITIINGSANFAAIAAAGTSNLSFSLSAAGDMSSGSLATLQFIALSGAYNATKTTDIEVGAPELITVGAGTSSQSYPIDRYYNYSTHEAIYLASELNFTGSIKSLAYHKASGADTNTITSVSIYMKHTSASTISAGSYSTTGYTLVYSGDFPNIASSGWMEVDLSNRFEYNGLENLSLLVIKGHQAWISEYPYWSYTTSSTTRARQARSDDAQPSSLTATTNLPNLRLKAFLTPAPDVYYPPRDLVANSGNQQVNLSWQAPIAGTPTTYKVYRNSTYLNATTNLAYLDSNVTNGTSYSYYVTALYDTNESDPSNTVSATPSISQTVTLGTGTSVTANTTASPINVYYQSLHGQSVYTATELNAAGVVGPATITQLGFNISSLPNLTMPNFVVRMKHTSAANVASWVDGSGLQTVFSVATYLPTTTGYNMLTLNTPFIWNGTDNILVDTAYGLIGSYTSTGTVEYTTVTNGYRYTRNDYADQTNVYSDSGSSTYNYGILSSRPNLRLVYTSQQSSDPLISATPTSVSEQLANDSTADIQIALSNTGTADLTWNIQGRDLITLRSDQAGNRDADAMDRVDWLSVNPVSGTILAGQSTILTLTLDSNGLTDGTYTTNLVILSNAANNPSLSVPVSMTVETPVNPYPTQPRFVAEWEPAKGAIVRYPWGLPYSMLRDLAANSLLYVVVTSSSQSTANSNLVSNSVNMANVRYINASSDSYWIRDYGPWTIFDADHNMHIMDFNYNRPRPNDNAIPSVVAGYLSENLYTMPFNHTGGNIMTDGMGKAMSTQLVLTENSTLSQNQIDQIMQNYLGISEYQLYPDPNNTYIDHIDCWAKLLDVDKVMIRRVPSTHAQYAAIEAVVAQWQTKLSSYGTPYRIFRVDTPNDEPYSNAYILNKKIFVPQMSTANDAAALQAYRNAMPGYTVTGYTHTNFESTDAIHCRVNTIFDDQMIALRHTPASSLIAGQSISMPVQISHTNPLTADTRIAWKHSRNHDWQYATLTQDSGIQWLASLSAPGFGDTLFYWINAADNAGKITTLPLCAGSDPFMIIVDQLPPNNPPVINLPASLSFAKNTSTSIHLSNYASDPDPETHLSYSFSGNVNLILQLSGSSVTITAPSNWLGTEIITFTVSDGSLQASDQIAISVTPINTPVWEPVVLPNTPAVVHAEVYITGYPAQTNDWVAAFVNGECRGTAVVNLDRDAALVTMDIHLNQSFETVAFKVYSHADDFIYDSDTILQPAIGETIGTSEPVIIEADLITTLDSPQPRFARTPTGLKLFWNSVLHAERYMIYASQNPDGPFEYLTTVTNPEFQVSIPEHQMFYYIKAHRGLVNPRN